MYFRQCQRGKYFHPASLIQCLTMLMSRKLLQLRESEEADPISSSSCYPVVSLRLVLSVTYWVGHHGWSESSCVVSVYQKTPPWPPVGAMRYGCREFLVDTFVLLSEPNAPLYYHSQCYAAAATACPFVIAGMSFVLLCFRRSFLVPVEDFTSALKLSVLATFSNPSR